MKRPDTPVAGAGGGDFPDEKWKTGLPTLVEYMTSEKWDDGKERELSSVAIKFQDGLVLAVLNDPEMRRGLYVTGDTVEKALKALERNASDPKADWRQWGGNKKKK